MPLSSTDSRPNLWFPSGYTPDATNNRLRLDYWVEGIASNGALALNLSPQLAKASGGDIRQVVYSMLNGMFLAWSARMGQLSLAQQPIRVTFTRETRETSPTPDLWSSKARKFKLIFEVQNFDVSPENESVTPQIPAELSTTYDSSKPRPSLSPSVWLGAGYSATL